MNINMAATGGDVSGKKHDIDKTSEDEATFVCGMCAKKNIETEAEMYCLNCQEYYCTADIKLHEYVQALSGHVLVGKEEFKGACGIHRLPSIPTERCDIHTTKLIDMYCETHNEVGCLTCISTKHDSSCVKLYIPDNAELLFNAEKIQSDEASLRSAIKDIKEMDSKCDNYVADIETLATQADQAVNDFSEDVCSTVRTLQATTKTDLDILRKDAVRKSNIQKARINIEREISNKTMKKIRQSLSQSNNIAQQFVCSTLANMAARRVTCIKEDFSLPLVEEILFTPHLKCEDLFQQMLNQNSLGTFSTINNEQYADAYEISTKESIDIETSFDKNKCHVTGACTLAQSAILLADSDNSSLKMHSSNQGANSKLDCLQLPCGPFSACVIDQKEAAVTLPEKQQIMFISHERSLRMTRYLQLTHLCRGIAYQNDQLYISDLNTVHVYDVAGTLLRTFFRNKKGDPIFSDIRNIVLNKTGQTLFVADWQNGLIALQTGSGDELWRYDEADLKCASGVCADQRGSVFVCGFNVLQINEDGQKIREILSESDGISCPLAICFDRARSKLVVSQNWNKEVLLFTLAKQRHD